MGAAKGVVRRLPIGSGLVYDYIPVDTVVNQILVTGQHVFEKKLVFKFHLFKFNEVVMRNFPFLQKPKFDHIPLYIQYLQTIQMAKRPT